ncbi:hypothetical protein ABTL43_19555, partial [Acinetobacter baumannii]
TSKSIGPLRVQASAEKRGVFTDFDRHALRLATSMSNRLNLLSYDGETPLDSDGLKLNWSASISRAHPDNSNFKLDTNSESINLGLT